MDGRKNLGHFIDRGILVSLGGGDFGFFGFMPPLIPSLEKTLHSPLNPIPYEGHMVTPAQIRSLSVKTMKIFKKRKDGKSPPKPQNPVNTLRFHLLKPLLTCLWNERVVCFHRELLTCCVRRMAMACGDGVGDNLLTCGVGDY